MSLSRQSVDRKHVVVAPLSIVSAVVVASGVGWLLLHVPVAGAVTFVGGLSLSVFLRNFGDRAKRIGGMIALPLVGILVAPARADAPGGAIVDIALVVAAGVAALVFVALTQWCAGRLGAATQRARSSVVRVAPAGGDRRVWLTPTTRMAVQMGVGLASAFVCGFAVFPGHWGWCVLTAFIVSSGARGRGDAAYKGLLRLAGAIAGSAAAVVLVRVWLPSGVGEACAIFAILYVGFVLRDVNYAYWACCMTLVLALISRPAGDLGASFLGVRLEAILVGALCAVAAAWFVFPIRTEAVIRRRLADALLALDDVALHAAGAENERARKLELFEHRLANLADVAPPVRLHRFVFRRSGAPAHPATWIDLASGLHSHAHGLHGERASDERYRGAIRKAIGASRKAIGNHGKAEAGPDALTIGGALERLHETFRSRSS